MYRSQQWDFKAAYDHHFARHQRKEYFLHNKKTGVQSGTQYIDNEWRRLRKKIAEQSSKSVNKRYITLDHVLTAAWLARRSDQDLDATTKEICSVMGRTSWKCQKPSSAQGSPEPENSSSSQESATTPR